MPQFRYVPLCTPVPAGGCDAHGPDCPTPGKRPLHGDWASHWSLERPEGNAGVLCGPEAGLLVIDVDTEEAADTVLSWFLPPTFTVQSGRVGGGWHYYYRWPEGLERVPNRLDGVEIKGPGRQVVAWDSLHKSGRRYEKLGGTLAELPEAFVDRLRSATAQHSLTGVVDATPEAQRRLDALLAVLPDAEERHDGNWQATCPAHDDHDPSLVVTASENRLLVHCRAGCPVEDVMLALGMPMSSLWAAPTLGTKVATERIKVPLGTRHDLGTKFRLTELLGAKLPEVAWAVPEMVPEGLTLLAGPPKLGKSWFVLDLALSVAGGAPFLGYDTVPGDVLYLALEDSAKRLQHRANKVLGGRTAPERLELWTRAERLSTGLIPEVEEWLDAQDGPRLVIIDTLGRVQDNGSAETRDGGYADAVEALAGLQAMAASRGVAVVVVTHTKKGGWTATGDPLEAVLGSQGYAGTADSILVLKRDRGEDTGELFITGREITDEATLELTFDDEACRWALGGDVSTEQKILDLVTKEPLKHTKTQIQIRVKGRKSDVLREIAGLEDRRRIQATVPPGHKKALYGLPVPGNK